MIRRDLEGELPFTVSRRSAWPGSFIALATAVVIASFWSPAGVPGFVNPAIAVFLATWSPAGIVLYVLGPRRPNPCGATSRSLGARPGEALGERRCLWLPMLVLQPISPRANKDCAEPAGQAAGPGRSDHILIERQGQKERKVDKRENCR